MQVVICRYLVGECIGFVMLEYLVAVIVVCGD